MCATDKVNFRKAILPDEIDALYEFDRKAFHAYPADLFCREEWQRYESYWMLLDGKTIGCVAMETDNKDELWIASTAILPEFRRRRFGERLKQWEIDFARNNGYPLIGTIMRKSNTAIIRLNEKFGFTVRKMIPGAYSNPDETGIVMELRPLAPSYPS